MNQTRTLWKVDRDRLALDFHQGQTRAWESLARFVFMLAGTQGGKTAFGPWWLWREIKRGGPGDYIAATASYDLFKLKMLPEIRQVFERLLGIGRYWASDRIIELADPAKGFLADHVDDPMWGRIILRSAAAPGGLESATAKAAWLDECGQDEFPVEAWEAVLRRLSLYQGRVLGTTTIYNLGWLRNEVYEPWLNGDREFDVIQYASILNPSFPRAEYDRAKRRLPDWKFRMFYKGEFARPAGLIYGDFSDSMAEEPFPIPPSWPRLITVDFGGANLAIVWLAEEPGTERWHVYREWLGGGLTTSEYVQIAKEGLGDYEGDYEAAGGALSESQQRRDWAAAGLHIPEPTVGDLEVGISRVIELIKTNRFRVFRSCTGVRDELGSYRRKLDARGDPTEEIVDKRAFHRLDAIRYGAVYLVGGEERQLRTGQNVLAGYRG